MSFPQPSEELRVEALEESARQILLALGEDPEREGLAATPRRVARALLDLTEPMFGRCHIGYVPSGVVIGLSKLPRIVDVFAHRLQLQERLTREVAEAVEKVVGAQGVAVVMEARHLCVEMRGVQKAESETVTSCLLGAYRTDGVLRAEFMELAGRR